MNWDAVDVYKAGAQGIPQLTIHTKEIARSTMYVRFGEVNEGETKSKERELPPFQKRDRAFPRLRNVCPEPMAETFLEP